MSLPPSSPATIAQTAKSESCAGDFDRSVSEEEAAKLKRTSQNRLAQRAYRARKDNKIKELESAVQELMRARRACRCRYGAPDISRISMMERQMAALAAENTLLMHRLGYNSHPTAQYFQTPYHTYSHYPRYGHAYPSTGVFYGPRPQDPPYAVPAEHDTYATSQNGSTWDSKAELVEENNSITKLSLSSPESPSLKRNQTSSPTAHSTMSNKRGIHFLLDEGESEETYLAQQS
ncbi:hypothetical protein HDU77_009302 [Chytriomyces hyalinus]|nr:hypothetical protein HDU77_009302 [Chytriomyces hyalinus]